MTDKEKIKNEVERFLNEWRLHSSPWALYRCEVYREILELIDSTPDEPSAVIGVVTGTDNLDSGIEFPDESQQIAYNKILDKFTIGDKVKVIITKSE